VSLNPADDALEQLPAPPQVSAPAPTPAPAPAAPAPAAPARDVYDEILDQRTRAKEAPLRQAISDGTKTTPDRAAQTRTWAQQFGLPQSVIDRHYDDFAKQAKMAEASRLVTEAPHLAEWMAADPGNAAVVADDHPPLTGIESALAIGRRLAGSLPAGLMGQFSAGVWGAVRAGAEALDKAGASGVRTPDFKAVAQFAGETAREAEGEATLLRGPKPANEGWVASGIYSGLESVGGNVPSLILGMLTGGAGGLALMGATTGGQSYQTAREQGLDPGISTLHGALQGIVEVATEAIPFHRLLGDIGKKTFVQLVKRQILPEIAGEEIATFFQDLNEWAFLPENKNKTAGDYLRARPSAAASISWTCTFNTRSRTPRISTRSTAQNS